MKFFKKTIRMSFVMILSFSSFTLWEQTTGAVKGTIRDAKTEEPLQGVKITIVSSVSQTLIYELRSNKKGHFYRSGLAPGVNKATFEKDGYIPLGTSIKVNLSVTVEVEIKLEQLLSLDTNYSEAFYQLGIIFIGLGETEKAKEFLQKFIEMDPENKSASLAKEILKSLN